MVVSGTASNISPPSLKRYDLSSRLARQTVRVHADTVDRTSAREGGGGGMDVESRRD